MSRSLRLASYNIHRGVGADGRADYGRIAGVLEELQADVVALQEVGWEHCPAEHLLEDLAAHTKAAFIPGITLLDHRGHYGNAVLTRLPVRSIRRHDISVPGREPRGALELELTTGSASLQLVATHLGLKRRERRAQADQLLPLFERAKDGASLQILLGDLNEWLPFSAVPAGLRRQFQPSPAPATFPARRPLLALDRLYVRPAAALRSLRVHRSPLARLASDHLPLVADIEPGDADRPGQ